MVNEVATKQFHFYNTYSQKYVYFKKSDNLNQEKK